MEKTRKQDFIELDFTGKSDGRIFDTTKPAEAKSIGLEKAGVKPLIICVGYDMLLKGFEEAVEGKEIGKEYTIHLTPEHAFGKRNPTMIKTYSLTSFRKNNIDPQPGMTLQLDHALVRVMSVTGGRVLVDFNNPLAGKEIDYEFKIIKKITDETEKINALQDYFFRQRYAFKLENKKVIFTDGIVKLFLEMLGEKFKTMTGLDFVVEEKKEEKPKEIEKIEKKS